MVGDTIPKHIQKKIAARKSVANALAGVEEEQPGSSKKKKEGKKEKPTHDVSYRMGFIFI